MNNLLAAIMNKCAGSDLSNAVGGRIFEGEAPSGTEFPYVVFMIVTDSPDDNFTDFIDEIILQFSIYSISKGLTEITGTYANLIELFDYCALNITGYSHIGMARQNTTTMVDEVTTPKGTETLRHWAVEYLIRIER